MYTYMRDKLREILSRPLDPHDEDDELLHPIRGLHEVIGLELEGHLLERISEPHVLCLEICVISAQQPTDCCDIHHDGSSRRTHCKTGQLDIGRKAEHTKPHDPRMAK